MGVSTVDDVPEDVLVKYTLLAFQGLDSSVFRFDTMTQLFIIEPSVECPFSTKQHLISVLKGASTFKLLKIYSTSYSVGQSTILNCFNSWIQAFISDFMKKIATITTYRDLTLRSLLYHLSEDIFSFGFIHSLLPATDQSLKGKAMLSLLWEKRSITGCVSHIKLIQSLISYVQVPLMIIPF